MAEWSKATHLSCVLFGGEGSNPSGVKSKIDFCKSTTAKLTSISIILSRLTEIRGRWCHQSIWNHLLLWPSRLRRRAYNAEIVGSSPTRSILKLGSATPRHLLAKEAGAWTIYKKLFINLKARWIVDVTYPMSLTFRWQIGKTVDKWDRLLTSGETDDLSMKVWKSPIWNTWSHSSAG